MNETHSVNELVDALNSLLCTQFEPEHLDPRSGDVPESVADNSMAQKVLGYQPFVDFEAGLEGTIAWVSDHAPAFSSVRTSS